MNYSVKIIDPMKKGGFIIEEWKEKKFLSKNSFEEEFLSHFSDYITEAGCQFGYLCSGHGFKGKQRAIDTDEDVENMYVEYSGKKSTNLWLKSKTVDRKRPSATNTDLAPKTKKSNREECQLDKMDELQKIVARLKEKHKDSKYSGFSAAQFHCWGNTIQLGHHDSYDDPPSKPFFGSTKSGSFSAASPGKRIRMRSECIDQLTKWHKLLDTGAISSEDYKDMHSTILADIKKT